MNDKKQTAVEWLVENILTHVQDYKDWDIEPGQKPCIDEYINKYIGFVDLSEFVNKAKEMEKEQNHSEYMRGWKNGYSKNEPT